MRAFVLILLACFCGSSFATKIPARIQIDYTLSNGTITLPISEILEISGKQYAITSEAQVSGMLALIYKGGYRRKSSGLITEQGLRPNEFQLHQGKTNRIASFDWVKNLLTLNYDGKLESLPLPANTHDRLSFPYSFAFSAPHNIELNFSMTDGKKLSDYHYRIAERTLLKTNMGELKTLHIVKQHDKDDPGTEIWLAIDHYYLPVRILVIEDNGDKLDQVVKTISYRD